MNKFPGISFFKKWLGDIDWKLLIFLLLFPDVKTIVKVIALVFIYLMQWDFRFRFRFRHSRLPLFYVLVIAIALFNYVCFGLFQNSSYHFILFCGILFWLACVLCIHQIKLLIEKLSPQVIHQTILIFFIINAALSFFQIASIIFEIHDLNPYRFQGMYQKYFIGTGDYIKGVFFDTSTTNAIIDAFGVCYFLVRRKIGMVFICMIVLLLTASNFTNILLIPTLLWMFVFRTDRDQKSIISICLIMAILFMVKISPQNDDYALALLKKPVEKDSATTVKLTEFVPSKLESKPLSESEMQKLRAQTYLDSISADRVIVKKLHVPTPSTKPVIPQPSIHSGPYQHRVDTGAQRRQLISFVRENNIDEMLNTKRAERKLPGKLISMQHTFDFLKNNSSRILTGDGIGNFSSKLAFRATGLNISGGFPASKIYINPDFKKYHLKDLLFYFTGDTAYHSLVNTPDSVLNQMAGEYGILGLIVFCVFYIGYFIRHYRILTYGIPVLMIMSASFFIGYWFEQLSVILFFELFLLLDIKEHLIQKDDAI